RVECDEVAVLEKRVPAEITVSHADLEVAVGQEIKRGVYLAEAVVKRGQLRVDSQSHPGQRPEGEIVEQVREPRLVKRVVDVEVEIGVELEPVQGRIIAPRLEPVAHAEAPDRPVVD